MTDHDLLQTMLTDIEQSQRGQGRWWFRATRAVGDVALLGMLINCYAIVMLLIGWNLMSFVKATVGMLLVLAVVLALLWVFRRHNMASNKN